MTRREAPSKIELGDPRIERLLVLKDKGMNSAEAAAKVGMDLKDVNKLWPSLGLESYETLTTRK